MKTKIKELIVKTIALLKSAIWTARHNGLNVVVECEFGEVKGQRFNRRIKFIPRSFLTAWVQLLRMAMADNSNITLTDTAGTGRTIYQNQMDNYALAADAALGDAFYGIMFGTGETAVDQDDSQLDSIIEHGTGAGELEFSACTVGTVSKNGNVSSFQVTRTVTNNSGGDITIKECGLGVRTNDAGYKILIERTILPTPYTVVAGATAYGRYTIRITT